MDKMVFVSRFLSENVPKIQERDVNSNLQQEPVENVSITDERQERVEKSDLPDVETIVMVTSLSSLSIINRYLVPHNQNLLQGRVYIPETVTVASSSSSQPQGINSLLLFLIPYVQLELSL